MLLDLRRYDDASAALCAALASEPGQYAGWCLLARAQLGVGDSEAALRSARQAATLAPDRYWPHDLISTSLSRLGRRAEAVDAAREAVRLAPDLWQPLSRLTHALLATKDRAGAWAVAERARELAPLEATVHIDIGTVAVTIGDDALAATAFEEALRLDPQNSFALNELGRLHLRASNKRVGMGALALARAAKGFSNAIRINPTGSVTRSNLELVVVTFLQRAGFILFVATVIAAKGFGHRGGNLRAAPVALLLLPGLYVGLFVQSLTPPLRRYLRRALLHPARRSIASAGFAIATSLVCWSSVAANNLRPGILAGAAVSASLAMLVQRFGDR